MMRTYEARYPSAPLSVRAIRHEVTAIARECGLEGQDLDDVALAVSEAATNAVIHGAQGADPCVRVDVRTRQGELRVTICDEGDGIKPRTDSPGAGLGLPVIATIAKRLEILSDAAGTKIKMAFACPNAVAV
jgi:serine/threonine-protein kinase RsbW